MSTKFLSGQEFGELEEILAQKYAHYLDGRYFQVGAEVQGDMVYATVTLKNEEESFFYPVEARMQFVEEDMKAAEAALFLIDYMDAYFEEYLSEGEDLFIPIDWTAHSYLATDFQIRGQVRNLKVERMADELLAKGERYEGPQVII